MIVEPLFQLKLASTQFLPHHHHNLNFRDSTSAVSFSRAVRSVRKNALKIINEERTKAVNNFEKKSVLLQHFSSSSFYGFQTFFLFLLISHHIHSGPILHVLLTPTEPVPLAGFFHTFKTSKICECGAHNKTASVILERENKQQIQDFWQG